MKSATCEIIEAWKEPTWKSTVEGSLTEVECELENGNLLECNSYEEEEKERYNVGMGKE